MSDSLRFCLYVLAPLAVIVVAIVWFANQEARRANQLVVLEKEQTQELELAKANNAWGKLGQFFGSFTKVLIGSEAGE